MEPSLNLESHIFRIIEGQSQLFDYLNRDGRKWNWSVDLSTGILSFIDERSRKPILSCPAFLIGSFSNGDMSFLWGWANESITRRPDITERWERLHQVATDREPDFLQAEPIQLTGKEAAQELVVRTAGFLNAFTFYASGYQGGVAYLAIDPIEDFAPEVPDAMLKARVLTMGISALSFDHRIATIAYLGEPVASEGDTLIFAVGTDQIKVTFDDQGRIADIQMSLSAKDVPANPPAPETAKRTGLLGRLFGRN